MDQSTTHPPSDAQTTALEAPSDQSLRVPCYCEENVWRLAFRKLHSQAQNGDSSTKYFVVFITNPNRCAPMFQQLAASHPSKPCYWDYHVILISHSEEDDPSAQVFDMDSHLPYPCSLEMYLERVFPGEAEWPMEYLPYFRLIDANVFLATFSSDRMHMYNAEAKKWNATPPTYACILPTKESNLSRYMYIDEVEVKSRMALERNKKSAFGTIYSLTEIRKRFRIGY